MAIRELHVLFSERTSADGCHQPGKIKTSADAVALMAPLVESEAVEVGYVICLTVRLEVIGYHQLSRGSLTEVVMHPREVYKAAALANAASVVLVHNHPSGDPTPSPDDLHITNRLKEAGDLMGIELLDHVIIGSRNRFVSIRELGRL
jgi:DNA repair protein RadC